MIAPLGVWRRWFLVWLTFDVFSLAIVIVTIIWVITLLAASLLLFPFAVAHRAINRALQS